MKEELRIVDIIFISELTTDSKGYLSQDSTIEGPMLEAKLTQTTQGIP